MSDNAIDEAGAVRWDASTGRTAVRMAPAVTAGAYFVIDPTNGGHYTDGVRERVLEWAVLATTSGSVTA